MPEIHRATLQEVHNLQLVRLPKMRSHTRMSMGEGTGGWEVHATEGGLSDTYDEADPPVRAGVLVKLSYYDPFFEFDEGDYETPEIAEVVGWRVAVRWPGFQGVASESLNDGYRAITWVPSSCVIREEEL